MHDQALHDIFREFFISALDFLQKELAAGAVVENKVEQDIEFEIPQPPTEQSRGYSCKFPFKIGRAHV